MRSHRIVPAVLAVIALCAVSCEEKYEQPVVVELGPLGAGGAPAGTAGAAGVGAAPPQATRVVPPPICTGTCCPTAKECYPQQNPSPYSGAECLAERDNTTAPRWQLRQTFSLSTTPRGLQQAAIANLLATRSELKSKACGASDGVGGFMQLIDFDPVARTSRTGFAKYSPDLATGVATGLCFVEEAAYSDKKYALPQLYTPPAGWPKGLPPPMPMPWKVSPVTATQLDQDFTLPADRATLLARLDVGGDLNGKGNGVFFYDKTRGYMHGFSPVTYIVNYDNATQYAVVPIREAEITQWFNDPLHPNCSGSFLGANPALPATCIGDTTNRAWGCPEGNCAPTELAPTKIAGYFLLAELEQVSTVGQTFCNLFDSGVYPGWTITANAANDLTCRSDSHFNPLDSVNGLPRGDWCATTNQPGSDTCHDALQSVSYATFQAFPINDGVCPAI